MMNTTWAQAPEASDKTLIDVFISGGFVMYFLLILSILVITFTVENLLKFRRGKLAPQAVIAMLQDAMNQGNYQQAIEICQSNPSFLTNILIAGLQRLGSGKDAAEAAIADTALALTAKLKASMSYLSVIGATAPMFGLFGTTLGIIGAFDTLAKAGVADMASLSEDISVALVTTAGGLVVAIPAYMLYYVVKNQSSKLLAAIDLDITILMENVPYDQLAGYQFAGPQQ
ncbi:MAG: MotA/TolQ/ExbB proton channel family protein [Verrucomicrobiota bacterium]